MALPTGTVTFLFTDIEGSTGLARRHRKDWETLRARHHAILREAIETRGGYVFQIVGDAFCAAFPTAEDAISAAVEAQTRLGVEEWPEGATIRVRMGIHTGKAALQENGEYQGYLAMSRVQRLMSLAQGGQVLLSLAAHEQASEDLPGQVTLRDLGEHRLKNIERPERIFQLIIPGLQADFPALKGQVGLGQPPAEGLVVRLMGRFEIRLDGKVVPLASRTAESLFAYLVLNAGVPHRREKLVGMFWPEEPEGKARAYLRTELWRIRKSLAGSGRDYLLADNMKIMFDPSAGHWLDADVLRNLGNAASGEDLKSALSLCEGELLPGIYDEWCIAEREHLEAVYEARMGRLLEMLEVERRWNEILDWAERWILHGRVPEEAYRALMTAYDAQGDRGRVAATYRRCLEALRQLDLEPSEKTRALALKRTSRLNLPIPQTSFIGRKQELDEITQLLSRSHLVTLTGSGGVGKTRLSIETAADLLDRFPDGVWFVDLAPLRDPLLVPNTLAGVLNLSESGETSVTRLLIKYLSHRTALLVLDNCEHLIEACAQLAHELLAACGNISILATSREALRVPGEISYRVPSLGLPGLHSQADPDALSGTESVRLFVERAALAAPGFAIGSANALPIARICQRLDGIPLAIELAAARAQVLGVEQILLRLDDRFHLLTSGPRNTLPRHKTLQAAIEWSYDLLSAKEQLLFSRLAVFSGGWTLDAAEAVCTGDGIQPGEVLDLLSGLVDKSLVLVEDVAGGKRYRRLETIRQFARDRLAQTPEAAAIRDRHAHYFVAKTEQIEPLLMGPSVAGWMDLLDQELDNLRLALEWSFLEQDGDLALRLIGSLAWFCYIRCHCREALEWSRRALELQEGVSKAVRAKAIGGTGWFHYAMGDLAAASACSRESAERYRQIGDLKGLSTQLQFAGVCEHAQGNKTRARLLLDESLRISRSIGNEPAMPRALMHLGGYLEDEGDREAAMHNYQEALSISRKIGEDHLTAMVLNGMGNFFMGRKEILQARRYFAESLDLCVKLKNMRTTAEAIMQFSEILSMEGEYLHSARLQGFAEMLLNGSESMTPWHLVEIGRLAEVPRLQLGEDPYREQVAIGRGLTLDQAVRLAVEERR